METSELKWVNSLKNKIDGVIRISGLILSQLLLKMIRLPACILDAIQDLEDLKWFQG